MVLINDKRTAARACSSAADSVSGIGLTLGSLCGRTKGMPPFGRWPPPQNSPSWPCVFFFRRQGSAYAGRINI